MGSLIDTHAHLDFPELYDELPLVLKRARAAGVGTIITIGIDIPSSRQAVAIAQAHDHIYATVGIHPHDAFDLDDESLDVLRDLVSRDCVVAVGETGLDYYRNRQPRPLQQQCLRSQLELAGEVKRPVVFHVREAFEDFFEIVTPFHRLLEPSVFHCFSGDWEVARRALDMGFYLSIPGTVTFPKAEVLQDVVRRAPMERLLLETDAPFLAPVPYRGKVNEPAYVVHTAAQVAELRGISLEEVAYHTTRNARTAFRLLENGGGLTEKQL